MVKNTIASFQTYDMPLFSFTNLNNPDVLHDGKLLQKLLNVQKSL